MSSPLSCICRADNIVKRYAGNTVLSLDEIAFESGTVHAVIGHNGAGKSTLVKVLAGAIRPDAGTIRVRTQTVDFGSPADARRAGISVVYQDSQMVPEFTVAENMALGLPYPRFGPFVRKRVLDSKARVAAQRLALDPGIVTRRVKELSVADRKLAEICRALSLEQELLVLDEPTAALTSREVERLFETVRALCTQGVAVLYISHRLDELAHIAKSITIMRDGVRVATVPGSTTQSELVSLMTGDALVSGAGEHEGAARAVERGDAPLLAAHDVGIAEDQLCDVALRPGEIVGLAGLVGSGRTRLARALAGLEPLSYGTLTSQGRSLRRYDVRAALKMGVAFVPEDRKAHGLVLSESVGFNVALGNFASFARAGLIQPRRRDRAVRDCLSRLSTRYASLTQPVSELSGGNQQKVLLARWILRGAKVFILDEPTAGLDVGAQADVFETMRHLAAEGAAVLYVASDFDELLEIADRALVVRNGRIVAELAGPVLTKEMLVRESFGLATSSAAPTRA